jgi:hypothetical protein
MNTVQSESRGLERYAPLFLWGLSLVVICLVPLLITGRGYAPMDDALRHVAKVVSGRSWDDVVVLADWAKTDHNPGWHFILGIVHRVTGCDADTLLVFSVVFTFACFAAVPLIWLRHPEIWIATLLIGCVISEALLNRLTIGRPLVIAMSCAVALLLVWRDRTDRKTIPWRNVIQSIAIITIAAWVHGAWYLFCLPAIACAISGRWRDAGWLALCWIAGSLFGALLTGHPIAFLVQAVEILWHSQLEKSVSVLSLASESGPSNGDKLMCIAMGVIYVWRVSRGATSREVLQNPAFILILISWIMGFKVARFWNEWGLAASLCWCAIQFQAGSKHLLPHAVDRCLVCLLACVAFVFATTNDLNRRWSFNLYASDELGDKGDVQIAEWLPGPGGVLYNTGMSQFYRFFFKYPHGDWRYVLGFEPTLMTSENLAIYANILKAPESPESYQDWVRKMGANDRLMVVGPEPVPIKELEWHQLGRKTWIGRLRAAKP